MHTENWLSRVRTIVWPLMLIGTLAVRPIPCQADPLQGITAPKADITLSFVVPGRVSEVLVQPGDIVAKDQLLVQLYDEPEKIQCEQLKLLSEDQTKILTARAQLDQKKVDLDKVEMARAKGAASDWEVEHLRLDLRIASLALQSSQIEQAHYQRRYDHALSQLAQMRLVAPLAGMIEDVNVETGESIGTLGPVIRLVQNDPLWIDIPVPMDQSARLAVGQDTWVNFPGSTVPETPNGRIINIASVADAASDTLRVRIEVPNPTKRPAGERVMVSFTPNPDDQELARFNID